MPSVIFRGKLISSTVCSAYEDNDAALYEGLRYEVEAAILCLTQRLKYQIRPRAVQNGLTEQEIDDTVEETVIQTILNIQRA